MRTACFSALQRAENSSTSTMSTSVLNDIGFSALQRAENSSTFSTRISLRIRIRVSVLFSEPKIPQFSAPPRCAAAPRRVSVLFSEPKIPQFKECIWFSPHCGGFQCSSASRKFLNYSSSPALRRTDNAFQCSSASRKFLNRPTTS